MGRGGKVSCKRNFKKRVKSKDKDSDGSDEDYVVSDEENEESEGDLEDYCFSLDEYASEESFCNLVEEEDEEDEGRRVRKVGRPKEKRVSSGNKKIGDTTPRKRKRVSYDDEEQDEDYNEEEEAEEDDDDEEFTLDGDDSLEEEEPLVSKKKNSKKVGRNNIQRRGAGGGRKKRRKPSASKRPLRKRGGRKRRSLRRKERCDDDEDGDLMDNNLVVREKCNKNLGRKRNRYAVVSDSDFVTSGSSDYEYTISEEEREQVREASKLCGSLRTSLRSSSSSKKIVEAGDLIQCKKPLGRKGKEKVEEVKTEVLKQVCGICLSEEDKRRLRGTLDCCSHYFCFTCIMEWSKVESRCPLCKQRFKTISKAARLTAGVDLRDVVIQVPKRDQVYQPTEEELRSYLDPYENVICTECNQGGDDGLMLLCDLCDSSAHTYCVGLGREVPAGNWYCDGCRPVALGSSSSQAPNPSPDQRTTGNNLYNRSSPNLNLGDSLETILLSSPRTPFSQGIGILLSPRFSIGDALAASPISGAGAPTLSGRRWIHRHIQNLLSINRMSTTAGRTDGMSTANLSNNFFQPQVDQSRELAVQPARTQEMGMLQNTIFEERIQDNPSSSLQEGNLFPSRLDQSRRQAVQDPTTTLIHRPVNLTLWPELEKINPISGNEQPHQCSSRSNIGSDGCRPLFMAADQGDSSTAREQLQSMVKTHLKNLSRDVDLGHGTFKDIAMSSTHTILAACGLEHWRSEVQVAPPPSMCSHVESMAVEQTSLVKGCCSSCFDSFVKDVVKRIMDTRLPQWLSLGL